MPFSKEVCDLLHLESTFERDGKVELASKEQKAIGIGIFFGNCLDLIVEIQNRLDLFWQRFQCFDHTASFSRGKIAHPSEEQREQRENNKLRRKRFGSRHTDLRSRVHINASVALSRDRARDVVTNPQGAKTFAPAFAQCTERVRSFAALADGKNQRLRSHRRITMAKLAGVIDFCRDVRQSLDQIFADSAGM